MLDVVPGLVRGQERDWRYGCDQKAKREIVCRWQRPGVSVAAMAVAHGLNANLQRKWATMASMLRGPIASVTPILLPQATQPAPESTPSGEVHLEVVLSDGTVHLRGRVSSPPTSWR